MIYLIIAVIILIGVITLLFKILKSEKKKRIVIQEKYNLLRLNVDRLKDHKLVETIIESEKEDLNKELKGATDEKTKLIINHNLSLLSEL